MVTEIQAAEAIPHIGKHASHDSLFVAQNKTETGDSRPPECV
jgi:hypothetical protein